MTEYNHDSTTSLWSKHPAVVALFVGLLSCLPYLSSIQGEFLNYDDNYLVVKNPVVTHLSVQGAVDPRSNLKIPDVLFLPVTDLTYILDARLYGYDDGAGGRVLKNSSAPGFSRTNLAWYAVAIALCTLLLIRLPGNQQGMRTRAMVVAALAFAWHPVHAESVAWISGRKDVVSAVFLFGALLVHTCARKERLHLHLFSALLTLIACLAKPAAVAIPFLVAAIEYLDDSVPWRQKWFRIVPTAIAAFVVAALSLLVASQYTAGTDRPGPWHIAAIDAVLLKRYILTAVLPVHLKLDHADMLLPILDPAGRRELLAFGSLYILVPAILGAWFSGSRWIRFGGLWFAACLVPALNLAPSITWCAERYLFLAVLGIAVIAGITFQALERSWPRLAMVLAVVGLMAGLILTERRARDFTTSERLWKRELQLNPGSALAMRHMGDIELRRFLEGEADRRPAHASAASAWFERAIESYAATPVPHGHEIEARRMLARVEVTRGHYLDALGVHQALAQRLSEMPQFMTKAHIDAIRSDLSDLASLAASDPVDRNLEIAYEALRLAGERARATALLGEIRKRQPEIAERIDRRWRGRQ